MRIITLITEEACLVRKYERARYLVASLLACVLTSLILLSNLSTSLSKILTLPLASLSGFSASFLASWNVICLR